MGGSASHYLHETKTNKLEDALCGFWCESRMMPHYKVEPRFNQVPDSAKGLGKLVRYIKGSLYRGSFPYITLLLG